MKYAPRKKKDSSSYTDSIGTTRKLSTPLFNSKPVEPEPAPDPEPSYQPSQNYLYYERLNIEVNNAFHKSCRQALQYASSHPEVEIVISAGN